MEKISKYIEKTNSCWIWKGETKDTGYGRAYLNGKKHSAHRLVYEILVGKIANGLEIDHLCRNRSCVNPKHLEPVSHTENIRRSQPFIKRKTHCKQGHEFTEENTYFLTRSNGKSNRVCRICKANAHRKFRQSRKS